MGQVLESKGATMMQCGQGFASMNPPMKELERLVLTWIADNMVARVDPASKIKPSKEKSREKIDRIVALRYPESKLVYEKHGNQTLG